jgi:hypothetical protein
LAACAVGIRLQRRRGERCWKRDRLRLRPRGRPGEPTLAVGDEPYISIDLPTEHSRWEDEDTVEHYCIHARVTRVTAESVALHLKQDQFIFILAPER